MKTPSISLILASGLAVGMLTSCVTPGDSNRRLSVTTTSYEPGYQISTLPSGYRREVISGDDYYYHDGAYYRRESDRYVVVEAPRQSRYYSDYDRYRGRDRRTPGTHQNQRNTNVSVLNSLPSGYRTVSHGGTQYYQAGENYYRRQGTGYVVVNRPY